MKVLILGGTGAMGTHLVNLLKEQGIDHVVTSRTDRVSTGHTQYIQGNARDIDFLKTVLSESWNVIVDFMIYSTAEFKDRVGLFLDATDQYVFLSSARVYADSSTPITESSSRLLDVSQEEEFLKTDEYSLAKARQEDVLRSSSKDNWTIIRPYITYSENRFQLGTLEKEQWLYRALHGRTIVFSQDICSCITTMTYGLDVAKGIAALLGKQEALSESFHITARQSCPWSEILSIYLDVLEKHLGHRPEVLLQDLDSFLRGRANTRYQVFYDRLFKREFDGSKIAEYLDTTSFTQVQVGLKKCLEHFLEDTRFGHINWAHEAFIDRCTKEQTSLKEIKTAKQKLLYLCIRYPWMFCWAYQTYILGRKALRKLASSKESSS